MMMNHGRMARYIGGLARYLYLGYSPGHFLSSVLSGDLFGTYNRADDTSMRDLHSIILLLYNHFPSAAFGNKEKVHRHLANTNFQEELKREATDPFAHYLRNVHGMTIDEALNL